jgi:hypothetical protein
MISVLPSPSGFAQEQQPDTDGVGQFTRAAEDYALMHRRLERPLPPIAVNVNPDTLRRAIEALAATIRAERRAAKVGDLFNPAAQATLRARIDEALRSHGFTAADVIAAERAAGVDAGAVSLHVNAPFPWAVGTAMFRCVVEALPPLPPELVYRMVGTDLVLIDVHASLIVDILPFALDDEEPGSKGGSLETPHALR